MSIRKRGNSYMVDLMSPTGMRVRRTFQTREDAELYEAQAKVCFLEGTDAPLKVPSEPAPPPPERPGTLGELAEATRIRYWQQARSFATIRANVNSALDYFGESFGMALITEDRLCEYVDFLKETYSPATVNRKLAVMSRMLKYAHRRGWIKVKVEIPRMKEDNSRMRWYTDAERGLIEGTFESLDLIDYSQLFAFLCDTGLRLGEALSLSWQDCQEAGITVWQQKGAAHGTVPITPKVREILLSRGRESSTEPHTGHGVPYGPFQNLRKSGCRKAWAKLRDALNVGDDRTFIWHTCRHTFCSRLVQKGVSLRIVKELARHQSFDTTLRYAHLDPETLETAMEALV